MTDMKFEPGSLNPSARTRPPQVGRPDDMYFTSAKSERTQFDDTLEPPPLPAASAQPPVALWLSFIICVVLPTLLVAIYFFFIASKQYQTEFRFEVTQGTPAVPGTPPNGSSSSSSSSSSGSSMLQALTGGQGSSLASAQNYVVVDYLQSPQAVTDLQKRLNVRAIYSRPGIDFLSRFNPSKSDEYLAKYWAKMVTADYDPMTGIATARVKAFTPQDSKLIADTLASQSENLVNNIINKPNMDAIKAAEQQVAQSQQRVKDVRGRLAAYRSSAGVIDPTQSVVPTNTSLVGSLRPNVIQMESQLSAMKAQGLANSPAASVMQARLAATRQQLAGVENEVAKAPGGKEALTTVVGRYEKVNFEVQFEQNLLDSALQTLAQTRAYALQQKMFIIPFVQPSLPKASLYPERLQSTLLMALVFFGAWLLGSLVFKAVQQHLD